MGSHYRSYRRNRPKYSAARQHISERRALSAQFAGIDRDIEQIFLNLQGIAKTSIFERYGRKFGQCAEEYAEKTYEKWQRGEVKMSGQTAERLLDMIPPLLSKSQRFDLVRKLRHHHLGKQNLYVNTNPSDWRNDVVPSIAKLIDASVSFKLPRLLHDKAIWLSGGDTQEANNLLAAAELEEARIRVQYLESEFSRIDGLIKNIEFTRSVNHKIEIPQGTINVCIEIPKKSLYERLKNWLNGF